MAQSKRSLLGRSCRIGPRRAPRHGGRRGGRAEGHGKREGGAGAGGEQGDAAPEAPRKPPPYTIPEEDPFVGRPGRDEIFAYGLRNPWRFSFDRAEDRIAIGDVGNYRFEEIDILPLSKASGATSAGPTTRATRP